MNRGVLSGLKSIFIPEWAGGGDPANDGALLGFDSSQPGGVKPVPNGTYVGADVSYVEITSNTTVTTQADVAGLTTGAITLPAGTYLVEAYVRMSGSVSAYGYVFLFDGATQLETCFIQQIQNADAVTFSVKRKVTITAGSHTFKVQALAGSGTGTITAAATAPCWLRVSPAP